MWITSAITCLAVIFLLQNAVDGRWSHWSTWSACSASCGIGLQRRDRSCSSQVLTDSVDGHCAGKARDDRICLPAPCHDGGWTEWSQWSACTRTCNGGMQTRARSCTNPPPSLLGRHCDGDPSHVQECSLQPCVDIGVGFTAKEPKDLTGARKHVTFGAVITNRGGGFDNNTGEFTCSVPGTYFFNFNIWKYPTASLWRMTCWLYKNTDKLTETFIQLDGRDSNYGTFSSSNGAFAHLDAGDTVFLGECSDDKSSRTLDYPSSFTGFLVEAD